MATYSDSDSINSVSSWNQQILLQVRVGQIKPVFGPGIKSAIYKSSISGPVKVSKLGCEGDEHGYEFHGGPDKAFLQYCSDHYSLWKSEIPEKKDVFNVG